VDFKELEISPELKDAVQAMGFEKMTPVQEQAIPVILSGRDIIACAQTGTGKTGAYLIPVINDNQKNADGKIKTLILAPTRELAIQIDQQINGLSYFAGVSSFAVYGGSDSSSWDSQKKALQEGADIIVATPGRIITHMSFDYADFSNLRHLILDEADRMLDMGFIDDLIKIVNMLPAKRQNLMFSATMPPKIRTLTAQMLNNPVEISIAISKPAEKIFQAAFSVYNPQKNLLLSHILDARQLPRILIFCSRKTTVKELDRQLRKDGRKVESIHSDLEQNERESGLLKFRNKEINILIATDVLSRGIDIENINLVINYDVPQDPEDYVHRIGRTARAETDGIAFTLVNEDDQRKFSRIENLIGKSIRMVKLPSSIGEGPVYDAKHPKSSPRERGGGGGGGRRKVRR
tara:strand:+ start:11910 stop:13127 length:1218 start_codon:yes stop_codon:yes gene_type:complete